MNIIKRAFLVVLSVGLLGSCSNPKTPIVTKEYLVEFNTDRGSFIPTQRIEENGTIIKPENPTKDYYQFEYWKHDGLKFEDSDFNKPVTDNMTLEAEWSGGPTPEEGYNLVTFDSMGGSFVDAVVVLENQIIPEKDRPANPTKTIEGYEFTFKYWYLEGQEGTPFNLETTPITKLRTVLKAKWEGELPDYHLVSFDSNGGSFVPSYSVKHGDNDHGEPTTPTKKIGDYEFTFGGWYTDEACTKVYTFNKPVNDDLKLFAKWTGEEPKKWAYVDFETNGGSHIDTARVPLNTPVSEPKPDPTREGGYEFDGWYDNAALSGNEYDFDKNVTEEKFTLYAKWKNPTITRTITFVMNGATSTQIEPIEVIDGNKVPSDKIPANPTKDGYTFKGWFKDAGLTQEFKFDTETVSQDYILYAKWGDFKTYKVEFYDGNTKLGLDQTVDYGDKVQRPANPTKENVSFSGWYQEKALTNLYNFDKTITQDDTTNPIKIYAKWDDTVFAVSFASNGGSFVQPQNIQSGETILTAPATTYTGYTFGGWYTDDVTFKKAFKFGEKGVGDPITSATVLYAKWTLIVYDVTIDYNYEGSTSKTLKINYNEVIPAQPIPEQYGYNFTGWYDAASGGNVWNFDTKITENTPKTIYAHWTKGECVIYFDAKGGSVSPSSMRVDKGTTYESIKDNIPTPTRPGNDFNGWSTSETSPGKLPEKFELETTVLYAHWITQDKMLNFTKEDPTAESGYSICDAAWVKDGYIEYPSEHIRRLKVFEAKDGYELQGFATTIERAEQGKIDLSAYDGFYDEITFFEGESDVQLLFPVYKVIEHTIYITFHDVDIYTELFTHGYYDTTVNGTPVEGFTEQSPTVSVKFKEVDSLNIHFKVVDDAYPYSLISYSLDTQHKMFPLKCIGGTLTGVEYIQPQIDTSQLTITITKATGDIYMDAWIYAPAG